MTISIWRYSHLLLAVSSAVFIFIATVTGIILAVEPISNQLQPYAVTSIDNVPLVKTISALQNQYEEVVTLEVDKNDFVIASVITKDFESQTFYINPNTGEKIGEIIKKAPIFEFATNLHRSLFLKSTGRFLVGLFSLLLFLIAVTGIKLTLKRQGGIKKLFSKVVYENFEQYYHVILSRYALIPIVIVTLTGVFLSLERFEVLPSDKVQQTSLSASISSKKITTNNFEIFKNTPLAEVKRIEFPFSDDAEDYFILILKDAELYVHQYTGAIISKGEKPLVALVSYWSMVLHTGQGTIIWSLVLLVTCFAILFFMYTGFAMTLKRRRETKKITNQFSKDDAEYIILVGSETGTTYSFAKLFYDALLIEGKSAFIAELNRYTYYKKAKQLVVFTATYGEGEAASNAKNFKNLVSKIQQTQNLEYAVLGFGSLSYPEFCKYAIVVDSLLQQHQKFTPNLPLEKINNQSFDAFKSWIRQWSKRNDIDLKIEQPQSKVNYKKLKNFTVIKKTVSNIDDTFLLQLRPNKRVKFQSGDLLAFYPKEDQIERLYSVAKVGNDILLSIKKHEFGVCSKLLNNLEVNATIKAKVKQNLDFHFPNYAKAVVMIANGTGIAPFLGMLTENKKQVQTHLFWGGRTKDSLKMYSEIIDSGIKAKRLSSFYTTFSQEQEEKMYVQNLIEQKQDFFATILKNEGIIMICGSIAMQNRVLEVLNTITTNKLNQPLSVFENKEQIKMDCY